MNGKISSAQYLQVHFVVYFSLISLFGLRVLRDIFLDDFVQICYTAEKVVTCAIVINKELLAICQYMYLCKFTIP